VRNVNKILVFTGGGIGDIIMSIPVLRSLGVCFKEAKIDIAISSRVKDVIDNLIQWHEIIVWDNGMTKKTITRSLVLNYDLYLRLRRNQYDLLIDLESIETKQAAYKRFLLYKFINPKRLAGRDTDGRGFFLDYKAKEVLLSHEHEVERRIAILGALGCDVSNKDISIEIGDEFRKTADNIFKQYGVSDDDFVVGINPNAFRPTRLWSVNKYILLAKMIRDHYGVKIAIVGGKDDQQIIDRFLCELGNEAAFALVGLNLMTLAAAVARMDIFVSNDTGPMHIAAAVKTPVVAVFGPENPYRYQPYLPEKMKRVVFLDDISCRPCTEYQCNRMDCLEPVSVDMVWEQFKLLSDTLRLGQHGYRL